MGSDPSANWFDTAVVIVLLGLVFALAFALFSGGFDDDDENEDT